MLNITILHSILLGIIEGLTEFIPVSSTGHLILATKMLNFAAPPGKVFEISIQLGAILAICFLYRQRLIDTARTFTTSYYSRHFVYVVTLAFLPSAVFGLFFHSFIEEHLFSPWVVVTTLFIGGIIIILVEKFKPNPKLFELESVSYSKALAIGLFQCLAMIPGTSRSGATIMGSMLLKIERKTATELSFFLAIPTMFAATIFDIYKNFSLLTAENFALIAIGFIVSFITALFVVRTVISFISRHGFIPFAIYRIILSLIMLIFLL